jgi:hypothetical protein
MSDTPDEPADSTEEEVIVLERVIQGELPFTLNLPEDTYTVLMDGAQYDIDILQDRIAVADGPQSMQVGTADSLRAYFGDRWDAAYKHELRTIVRHREEARVRRGDLPAPTDDQLFEAAQQHILHATPGIVPGSRPQLQAEARQWMAGLDAETRTAFTTDTSVRLAAAAAFRSRIVDIFCDAVNVLIRLYMATFQDIFVQEITESMFSGTAFHGLPSVLFCNGQQFDQTRYVGGAICLRAPTTVDATPAPGGRRLPLGIAICRSTGSGHLADH